MNTLHGELVGGRRRPWGLWPTLGFSLAVGVSVLTLAVVIASGFAAIAYVQNPEIDMEDYGNNLQTNGLFLALVTLLTSATGFGLTLLFVALRDELSIREYLALNRVRVKTMVTWLSLFLLFVICSDMLGSVLRERSTAMELMVKAYETAYFVPLLWIAIVLGAPLFEEILFRGFIFRGLQHSRLGSLGAILLTAFVWSAVHIGYDPYDRATLFVAGILLGSARLRSESVYPAVAMHSVMNLIAMMEIRAHIGS